MERRQLFTGYLMLLILTAVAVVLAFRQEWMPLAAWGVICIIVGEHAWKQLIRPGRNKHTVH